MLGQGFEDGFYHADCWDVLRMLEPGSVDMILTDPVYDDTQAYIRLLHKAQHVLRDDSAVLMFASTNQEERIRHVAELMVPDMRYTYTLNYIVKAKPSKLRGYNLFTWRTPVLWYRKGKGFPNRGIPDTYIASTSTPDGDHAWNKNIEVMRYWITAFTRPGDLVLDPFCGSGSVAVACKHTGRRHISIDIDSDTVQAAAQRYENVRAEPLLMTAEEAYQLSFFEEDHG